MIRTTLILAVFSAVAAYALRDWFKSLCALIALAAVIEVPDVPKAMLGVPGLNPWNVALAFVLAGWAMSRGAEGLRFDLPQTAVILLIMYGLVVLVSFSRMMADPVGLERFGLVTLFNDQLVNSLKWLIPGALLFDGVRTRPRLHMALVAVLALYVLLGLQVARWMPASAALEGGLTRSLQNRVEREVGYSTVNLSMMLAGTSWALLCTLPLFTRPRWRIALAGLAVLMVYAQALTGGRMGYVTWGFLGLLLMSLRWRKWLPLAPAVPLVLALAFPGATQRMLTGFGETDAAGQEVIDDRAVTASRTLIWPMVIEKISQSAVIGYGREAMARTGLRDFIWYNYNQPFAHPHNAYLQLLLDNGVVGFLMVMPFWVWIFIKAARHFALATNPDVVATAGVCLCLVTALLVASMGSQTFYPREEALGIWCAIGLLLRVDLLRRAQAASAAALCQRRAWGVPSHA